MNKNKIKFNWVISIFIALFFCFTFINQVFAATNLLTNPGHETGDNTGWTGSVTVLPASSECYDWPNGSNAQCIRPSGDYSYYTVQVYEGSYALFFSYTLSSSQQTIDLTSTYTTEYLDTAPDLLITDHVYGPDYVDPSSDTYRLQVILKNGSGGTIASYDTGNLSANNTWQTLTHTFSSYGSGLRSVQYIRYGQSAGLVQGAHGPAFDSAFVGFADTTNPSVLYYNPADDATGVGVDDIFEIAFDEAIATSTGNIILYKTSDDSLVETIDIESVNVTASSTTALLINPSTTLDSKTEYYFMIDDTAINDSSGNSYAGITASTTWSFITADVQNPTATLSPLDDATSVATDSNLVITFDEVVDAESGNITIYKTSGDSTVETFDVTADISGSGSTEITINPSSDLLYETEYYVIVDATAFDDTSGNSYAGITASTTWSFITADTPACDLVDNAGTYNAWPTCGVATCNAGYALQDGACIAIGGAGPPPPSYVGSGGEGFSVGMGDNVIIGLLNNKGKNVQAYITSQIMFWAINSSDSQEESHFLSIKDLDMFTSRLTIVLASEPLEVFIDIGETKKVDLDNDGIDDIEVKYVDLVVNRVEITINQIQKNSKKIVEKYIESELITKIENSDYTFTRNLFLGMTGEDVYELQRYLNNQGFILAEAGYGSPGNETNYFGSLTKIALTKFQEANNIQPAWGYFGPITRGYLNN